MSKENPTLEGFLEEVITGTVKANTVPFLIKHALKTLFHCKVHYRQKFLFWTYREEINETDLSVCWDVHPDGFMFIPYFRKEFVNGFQPRLSYLEYEPSLLFKHKHSGYGKLEDVHEFLCSTVMQNVSYLKEPYRQQFIDERKVLVKDKLFSIMKEQKWNIV